MIQHVLICSLMCTLMHVSTHEGMIFHRFAQWYKKDMPVWLIKPLFDCLTCMCSIWGTSYWLLSDTDLSWLVFVLAVGGMNTIIASLLELTLFLKMWICNGDKEL